MKCTLCGVNGFRDNLELANHILESNADHSKGKAWARELLSRKGQRQSNRQYNASNEPICSLCHKPIGKQDSEHCCC